MFHCAVFCFSKRERNTCCGGGFCKGDASSELNGLFKNMGVGGILEGKEFEAGYMLFSFVAAFVDLFNRYVQSAPMR